MAQDDIQGQVVDAQGNPVDGAIVELTKSYQSSPLDEQVVRRTTTDANGNYIFEFHPDGDGTTQEWHVSAYNHDGSAYVNSFNNPGVTAELPSNAIPDSAVDSYEDTNLSEYAGQTADFDFTTSISYDGDVSLTKTSGADTTHSGIWWDETTLSQDDPVAVSVYSYQDRSTEARGGVSMVDDSGAGYMAYFDSGGAIVVTEVTNGTFSSNLSQSTFSHGSGWFEVVLSTDGAASYTASVRDASGTELDSTTTSDTNHNPDRHGVSMFDSDCVFDLLTISEGYI